LSCSQREESRHQDSGHPEIRADNLADVVAAIKKTLEVREGRSGDALDGHITYRALQDMGLVGEGKSTTSTGTEIPVTPPGGGDIYGPGYNPSTDFGTPPAPQNLVARGGFSVIYLTWGGGYANPAITEIWRATTDNLGAAILVGTSVTVMFSDPVEPYTGYYYWVRYVSKANVTGPYNSTSGTYGQSAIDVVATLEALSADIAASSLWGSLTQQIGKIQTDSYVANRALQSELNELRVTTNENTSYLLTLNSVTENQATSIRVLESRGASGNRVFFDDDPPDGGTGSVGGIPLLSGDIWYETDAGYASWRWSGTVWVEFVVEGQKIYHRPDDPVSNVAGEWVDDTGRIMRDGDLWYDSDDANHPWRWNGAASVWVDFAGDDNTAAVIELEQTKIGYATLDATSSLGLAGSVFDAGGADLEQRRCRSRRLRQQREEVEPRPSDANGDVASRAAVRTEREAGGYRGRWRHQSRHRRAALRVHEGRERRSVGAVDGEDRRQRLRLRLRSGVHPRQCCADFSVHRQRRQVRHRPGHAGTDLQQRCAVRQKRSGAKATDSRHRPVPRLPSAAIARTAGRITYASVGCLPS
jgi:hypothetical protein